jgi:phage shock protein PspC (stress-responsive transcriptional regulator)
MKRLVKRDKKIFGVCGGLGEYFGIDPTIVRAIFLFAAVAFGTGILLYIILAIVMPDE